MTDRLRVGIVGVGWGALVQVPAFRAVPEYEVVALCSRNPDSVAAAGARVGIEDLSTDWQSFVNRDDLDIISVATPTALHHAQVLVALRAGKHVLCEKPVALTDADATEMLAVAEQTGRAHAVCFESRWSGEKYQVQRLVKDGFLGMPYAARASASVDFWHPSHPLQSEWMYRLDQGGGYLLGMAAHDLDFMFCLFGPPEAVCADVRTTLSTRQRADGSELTVDADDTASLLLRLRSGVHATLEVSAMSLHRNAAYRFEAFGTDGTIEIEGSLYQAALSAGSVSDDGLRSHPSSDRAPRSGPIAGGGRRAGAPIRQLALLLEDWLPAFDGKPTPDVPDLGDGLLVQRTITAARRSSAGEGWVTV